MGLSSCLFLLAAVMIMFHPGSEKIGAAEKTLWITIASNIVTLWLRSPGEGKKEAQVDISSEQTNVLTQDNSKPTQLP